MLPVLRDHGSFDSVCFVMWSHNKGTFTRHKFLLATVKEWLKSVLNCRSYPKNKIGYPFFWTTLYVCSSFCLFVNLCVSMPVCVYSCIELHTRRLRDCCGRDYYKNLVDKVNQLNAVTPATHQVDDITGKTYCRSSHCVMLFMSSSCIRSSYGSDGWTERWATSIT